MKNLYKLFTLTTKTLQTSSKFLLGALILSATSFIYVAFAAPPDSPYNLGETLAPTCVPESANCTVDTPQEGNAYLTDVAGITADQGDLIYFNGTDWVDLAPGTSGQFLKAQGASADPIWGGIGTGGIDMDGEIIENIGNAGTDFTATGGLILADELVVGGSGTSIFGDSVTIGGGTANVVDMGSGSNADLYVSDDIELDGKINIANTSTDNGFTLYQVGNTGTGNSDGAFLLNNTGNTGTGLNVYGNMGADAVGSLAVYRADNAAFDWKVASFWQDGVDACVEITHNGIPSGSNDPALVVNGPNDSTIAGAIRINDGSRTSSILINKDDIGRSMEIDTDVTNINWSTGSFYIDAKAIVNDGATYTKSGSIFKIDSQVTETSGTITDSAIVLDLNQVHADATGDIIDIANAGSGDDISAPNFTLKDGLITTTADSIIMATQSPASGDSCTAGEIAWDASYLYVCTASGVWKRSALTGGY